jgi:hypothetical protein
MTQMMTAASASVQSPGGLCMSPDHWRRDARAARHTAIVTVTAVIHDMGATTMAGTEITETERAATIAAEVFATPVKDMAEVSRGTRVPVVRVSRLGKTVVVDVGGSARVIVFDRERDAISRYRREARAIGVPMTPRR